MDISVTEFRAHCLELIRQVEVGGEEVQIRRHGKLVARLTPPSRSSPASPPPWEVLHGSGVLRAKPEESVLDAFHGDHLPGRCACFALARQAARKLREQPEKPSSE